MRAVDKCGWWWWVFVLGLLVCVWLADRKLWQDRFAGEKSDAHEIVYSVQCSRRTVGNEGISKCEMYFTILLYVARGKEAMRRIVLFLEISFDYDIKR